MFIFCPWERNAKLPFPPAPSQKNEWEWSESESWRVTERNQWMTLIGLLMKDSAASTGLSTPWKNIEVLILSLPSLSESSLRLNDGGLSGVFVI